MTEIDQYQSRIFAALDRISRLSKSTAQSSFGADDRKREEELIEELEATLAEERASLQDERATVGELKAKLAQEKAAYAALADEISTLQQASAQAADELADGTSALTAAQAQAKFAEDKLAAMQGLLDAANTAKTTALGQARAAEEKLADLQNKLSEAEQANIDLSRDQARSSNSTSAMEEKIARLMGRIQSQDNQFQRLKDANATLRDSNAGLRAKNLEMLGDPTAINVSMAAELEALKVSRAADVEEMDAILNELEPLVGGQKDA